MAEPVLPDLFDLAYRAGFVDIHLELSIDPPLSSRIVYLSGVVATSDSR
jgi:hypothetical protein